ncbi:hypothetical protein CHI95_10225 [Providencia rettgeri]|uniref:Uncharacterized protein n=1 Tax=Providencia rettgeri TaxID=587 RepID=A0A264VV49_PRORE|nr:hypothetical protein CHI95_10225 [Providencia rettgeri]THB22629.1 hypothetical protein E6R27_18810 [Providencia sp. MGF014]
MSVLTIININPKRWLKIHDENQYIDFRLITQSGKNHTVIPRCQQPKSRPKACSLLCYIVM